MPKLSFKIDWVDAEGISGPELSATWASLEIRAGDSIITRVLDTRAKTVRDFVYVPLYPLAEWLATNWWFLSHELGNPMKEQSPHFHRRHMVSAGREGYAYPNLQVLSSGKRTHLIWKRELLPWIGIEFLNQGESCVDTIEFRDSCADFVDRVIRRLTALGVDSTYLQDEWAAIQSADIDESRFCETAAGIGWDPYAIDDVMRWWVCYLDEKLGDLLDEAVPALNPDRLDAWLDITRDTIPQAKRFNCLPLERLRALRNEVCRGERLDGSPRTAGYRLALRLRRVLSLDNTPLPTMEHIADAIGEDASLIGTVVKKNPEFGGWPELLDAVITRNDDGLPAFAFRRLGENGRRFHFCRALAEVLVSPGTDTLLTKAYTERQERNRSFAAEFLAPSSGLRENVSRPVVDGDDIDELAAAFGVSSRVIEHQMRNHGIAEVWQTGIAAG